MSDAQPKIRFSKVMEILLWLAGLGVLAENIFLFQQNRRLNEALAPQITAGTQLKNLAGIAFDARLESSESSGFQFGALGLISSTNVFACLINRSALLVGDRNIFEWRHNRGNQI